MFGSANFRDLDVCVNLSWNIQIPLSCNDCEGSLFFPLLFLHRILHQHWPSIIRTLLSSLPSSLEACNVFEIHPKRCRKVTKHDPHTIHVADICNMSKPASGRDSWSSVFAYCWLHKSCTFVDVVNIWYNWNISYNIPSQVVSRILFINMPVLAACHVLGQLLPAVEMGRWNGSIG